MHFSHMFPRFHGLIQGTGSLASPEVHLIEPWENAQMISKLPFGIWVWGNIRKIWELDGKKNMNLGCIYSVYIRIPYTAWLIITCLWRMHQEHAGPCHVAWKPALWTQPLNLDQDVTWNQGVHSEQMGISGLWGPKSCFSKLHQLEPATKGCAFYHVITIWCLLISSKLAY